MNSPFRILEGIAAPLPLANVDTDRIIAARFLKTVTRAGLGKALFHALRYADDGSERIDFVLNRAPWRAARILVTLDNFGCGSSREHAPWALADFGIECVIAPSFADIFYSNCFKNGILPIVLPLAQCQELIVLASDPATACFRIDLPRQEVVAGPRALAFPIDPVRKRKLLEGGDELSATLVRLPEIARFEAAIRYPMSRAL